MLQVQAEIEFITRFERIIFYNWAFFFLSIENY